MDEFSALGDSFQFEGEQEFADAWHQYVKIPPAAFIDALFDQVPGEGRLTGITFTGQLLEYTIENHIEQKSMLQAIRQIDFSNGIVFHGAIGVKEAYQRKKFSSVIQRNSMSLYRQMGVKRIETDPRWEVGGYANAKLGFLPIDEDAWAALKPQIYVKLGSLVGKIPIEAVDTIEQVLRDPDPRNLIALAYIDQGLRTKGIGEALLIGTKYNAKLDLDDEFAVGVFDRYVRNARIKP